MKRYLILILMLLLLVTGCKKNLTCTLNTKEDGYKTETKVVYNKNKNGTLDNVTVTSTMTFDSEELAKNWFNVLKSINESNSEIKQEKNKIIVKNVQDYSNSTEKIDEIKKQMESDGYTCK